MEETRGSYLTKENSEGDISVKGLPGIQLTEEEEKEIGNVGWKQFLDYILISKGSLMLSSAIITQIGFVALQAVSSYWLAFGIQIPKIGSGILIGVYTTISTSLSAALLGLKASKALFSDFTNSIFNALMLFFDSTPVGRILTRASSDLCVVDFDIPFSFAFVVAPLIESVAIISIMALVMWQVLFVAFFATVASKYVQGYYQASARELMRINGTTKAPVMNYAAETSLGVFMHIPPEPPAIVEDRRPPSSWPSKGRIDLQDLRVTVFPKKPLDGAHEIQSGTHAPKLAGLSDNAFYAAL
ncbi:hypothetical protein HYC85_019861 [Camellia sinensis]|uniref:ABC transmembrane type-1 domain-containing protein n=1 Tax=Camellia sinensis TaxID=4442 RepID=A0A7J7GN71_CAMSI|nr:hypothetical protein HYC85_019861 [Camellia sinensis]